MTTQPQKSVPYRHGSGRSPELTRRNRRVALIVALVAVALVIFTFVYVTWFGGVNVGPQKPMHSELAPGATPAMVRPEHIA